MAADEEGRNFIGALGLIWLLAGAVWWVLAAVVRRIRGTGRRRGRAASTLALDDVLELTPREFEDLTAELLARLGYTGVRRTGGAGDLGADIVCHDPEGRSTIVQCKRFAPGSTVGSKVVQTFIGMQTVHHRAERGMIVTSSGFSQPAARLARQHGIVLVDGPRLLSMLQMTATPVRPVGAVR